MMKDAIITLIGTQEQDGNSDTIELTSVARYGVKNGEVLITYDESELLGVKGVKTTLHYKAPDTVLLKRTGSVNVKLVIEKNKRNCCRYDTGYGELLLDIIGEEIENRIDDGGGTFYMSYRIDTNNRFLSKNTIKITVKDN